MKMAQDLFTLFIWTLAAIMTAVCLYMAWHYPDFTPWGG